MIKNGFTALHIASQCGYVYGWTALIASREGHADVMKVLKAYGGEVDS